MKQLLCFGDSNTWGWNPVTHERYPWGVRWTSILEEKLAHKNVRVLEEGMCGRTSAFDDDHYENMNGLRALPVILDTNKPIDGAVIMIGTNDCKGYFGLTADQITKGAEQCVDEIMKYVPAEKILLVSPILLGEKVWMPGYDPEFNEQSVKTARELKEKFKKLAAEKGICMMAASDYAEPSEEDQEHLTEEGHKALADAICSAIEKIL